MAANTKKSLSGYLSKHRQLSISGGDAAEESGDLEFEQTSFITVQTRKTQSQLGGKQETRNPASVITYKQPNGVARSNFITTATWIQRSSS